ncbi:unnamed protein product [Mycena citricolor]|uniref:HNH nuclease domain-containing protein n=1 Tax=Mycena citricolor TaxID=2018698 RepID=A0AAD2K3K8_9AGAR|nr:unnamed protein product [Mycena citricolor]
MAPPPPARGYLLGTLSKTSEGTQTEPASSQTPTIDKGHAELRDLIADREQHRCAITGAFDRSFVTELLQQGRGQEIPDVPQLRMQVAHVLPFLLNDLDDPPGVHPQIKDPAQTRDMLQSWTNLDFKKLFGSKINSPMNAIFMTAEEHHSFARFRFYLEKHTYPNSPDKYRARTVQSGRRFSNGRVSTDVRFRQVEGIDPPNPQLLEIHAAFSRVLNLCGAAEYFDGVEQDAESGMTLRMDGTTDLGSLLLCRLPMAAH